MTLDEMMVALNIPEKETMERLCNDRDLLEEFLRGMPNEESYQDLLAAVAAGDRKAAENAAHTLKGVSSNLGLTGLYAASAAMVSALRASDTCDMQPLLADVKAAFQTVCEVVAQ